MSLLSILAQTDESLFVSETAATSQAASAGYMLVLLIVIISLWKIFEKAGEAGWKAIIPFYNAYTLFRIAGQSGWNFILLFIPIISLIMVVIVSLDLAKRFNKSGAFGIIGLFLFPFVGYPMLAFGEAKYVGPKNK